MSTPSANFEKPPKDLRERALTKAETSGDRHVVRVYNWPALEAMGIDKKSELEQLGFVEDKQIDKKGNVWDMSIDTKAVEDLRRDRFTDSHGYTPEEFRKRKFKAKLPNAHGGGSPLEVTDETTLVSGEQISKFDE